jgi:hypothetical protein
MNHDLRNRYAVLSQWYYEHALKNEEDKPFNLCLVIPDGLLLY